MYFCGVAFIVLRTGGNLLSSAFVVVLFVDVLPVIRSSCLRSRRYWIFGRCIRRRRRFLGLYESGDGGAWAGREGGLEREKDWKDLAKFVIFVLSVLTYILMR